MDSDKAPAIPPLIPGTTVYATWIENIPDLLKAAGLRQRRPRSEANSRFFVYVHLEGVCHSMPPVIWPQQQQQQQLLNGSFPKCVSNGHSLLSEPKRGSFGRVRFLIVQSLSPSGVGGGCGREGI